MVFVSKPEEHCHNLNMNLGKLKVAGDVISVCELPL